MYIVAVPAYGRDYRSKREVEEAWNGDKDFLINNLMSKWDGRYFNKQQSEEMKKEGITHIQVRYKKLTQVIIIEL